VPGGQSRQIEMAILVGPTHPGASGCSFHQMQACAGNGHTPGSMNSARGACGGRRLRRLWLLLRAQRKRRQSEKEQRKEAQSDRDLSSQETPNFLTRYQTFLAMRFSESGAKKGWSNTFLAYCRVAILDAALQPNVTLARRQSAWENARS
jgi:hypothetical protein